MRQEFPHLSYSEFVKFNGNCNEIVKGHDAIDKNCWRGNLETKNKKKILMTGDSHAAHFAPLFDLLSKEMDFKFQFYSYGGNKFILNNKWVVGSYALNRTEQFDYYIICQKFTKLINLFAETSDSIKKILEMPNKKVLVFLQAPFSNVNKGKSCPVLRPRDGPLMKCDQEKNSRKSLLLSEKEITFYNEEIKKLSLKYKNFFYFDIRDYICPYGVCSLYYKNVRLYADNDHFTYGGISLVATDIINTYGIPDSIRLFLE